MLVRLEPLATTTTSFRDSARARPPATHSAITIVAIAILMAVLSEHPGGLGRVDPDRVAGEQALVADEGDVPTAHLQHPGRRRPEVEPEVLGADPRGDRVVGRPVVLVKEEWHHVPQPIEAITDEAVESDIAAIGHEPSRGGGALAGCEVVLASDHLALQVKRTAIELHIAAVARLQERLRHRAHG